jgi:iron complex transport system substrate-binding protein
VPAFLAPISRGLFLFISFCSRQGRFLPFLSSRPQRHCAAIVAAVFTLLTTTLSAQDAPASLAASASTREVVDEMGRKVRVPVNANRIISLAPSMTETLYALGLQDRLVGDTDYCDYPADAQKKPKVGGAINPNLEVIAALHPDLVLVTKALNRLETVRALDTLGIPSYATDPHSVNEIISSTEKLADVLGAPEAGKTLGDELHQRLQAIQEKIGKEAPKSVFFVVWMEPLISIGRDTFVAEALRKAGASSIVDSKQDWPQINLEEVVRLQPEHLIFAPSHSQEEVFDFAGLTSRPGWRILDAVRNHHFAIVSDAVIRPAPRIVSAIEELARQLHPSAFELAPDPNKEMQKLSPPAPVAPSGTAFRVPTNAPIPTGVEASCVR